MLGTEFTGRVRVEVWMRNHPTAVEDPRRTALSRLKELEAGGVVDDVSVRIWGRVIPASPAPLDDTTSEVHDRIEGFQRWADRTGNSLEPAFRWGERSTLVSDECSEVIRLPLQCLAVYEADQLAAVFPCTDETGAKTVTDCLERLEADDTSSRTG
jgi:hypothetical protein